MTTANRIVYIDALKGFAIFLVVFGHVLQRFYTDESLIIRVVYAFHVPLFMFISGYVSYKLSDWSKIKNRFVQLIIPFFSYILLSYFVYNFGDYSINLLVSETKEIILRPDKGLWFLWALFFINILFLTARRLAYSLNINEWIIVVIFAVILNGIELITKLQLFGYHWIAWYFIYFSFGVLFRKYMETPHERTDDILFYTTLILFPVCAFCYRMHNQGPIFYEWINLGSMFTVFYRLFVGILGILFSYELFKRMKSLSFNMLSKIGGGTLGIYYIHFFFLYSLPTKIGWANLPLYVIISSISILFMSFWLTSLCKLTKITRLLILGGNILKSRRICINKETYGSN